MSKRPDIFVSSPFRKDDVVLGSLVPNRRQPNQDALIRIKLEPDKDFTSLIDENFNDSWHTKTNATFKTTLTKLFSASVEHEPTSRVDIVADKDPPGLQSIVYTLKSPRELFRTLCADEYVRVWLEDGYKDGQDSYLVVAYRTLLNARVTISSRVVGRAAAKAAVPVGEIIGNPAAGNMLDATLKGSYSHAEEKDTSFVAMEERVFAVAYRKVNISFFNKRNMSLEKENCWMSTMNRSKTGEEAVIMVDVEEDAGISEFTEGQAVLGDECFIELISD